MMFKEMKEKRKQLPSKCFYKEKKNTKPYNTLFFFRRKGVLSIIRGFSLFEGGALESNPRENRGMSV